MTNKLKRFLIHVGTNDAHGEHVTVETEVRARSFPEAFAHVARIATRMGNGTARWHRITAVTDDRPETPPAPPTVKHLTSAAPDLVAEGFILMQQEAWAPVQETDNFDWITHRTGGEHAAHSA